MCFPSVCTAPNPSMKCCIYRELYPKVFPLLPSPLFGALPLAKVLPPLLFLFVLLFIYFWLPWIFLAAQEHSLAGVRGLLIAVASLVAEHRL